MRVCLQRDVLRPTFIYDTREESSVRGEHLVGKVEEDVLRGPRGDLHVGVGMAPGRRVCHLVGGGQPRQRRKEEDPGGDPRRAVALHPVVLHPVSLHPVALFFFLFLHLIDASFTSSEHPPRPPSAAHLSEDFTAHLKQTNSVSRTKCIPVLHSKAQAVILLSSSPNSVLIGRGEGVKDFRMFYRRRNICSILHLAILVDSVKTELSGTSPRQTPFPPSEHLIQINLAFRLPLTASTSLLRAPNAILETAWKYSIELRGSAKRTNLGRIQTFQSIAFRKAPSFNGAPGTDFSFGVPPSVDCARSVTATGSKESRVMALPEVVPRGGAKSCSLNPEKGYDVPRRRGTSKSDGPSLISTQFFNQTGPVSTYHQMKQQDIAEISFQFEWRNYKFSLSTIALKYKLEVSSE
ncbi:hypothetical protein AAG570_013388 [Ranatra chinensis]|uniref:Uncharacterized protein n=1 Tax=Ranatra chinensis TaxID=642074 RepID=A0ABD0YDX6_9HEMI